MPRPVKLWRGFFFGLVALGGTYQKQVASGKSLICNI